jgi:hypothetical protein
MRSAADMDDVGCPEPAAVLHRMESTRSCCPSRRANSRSVVASVSVTVISLPATTTAVGPQGRDRAPTRLSLSVRSRCHRCGEQTVRPTRRHQQRPGDNPGRATTPRPYGHHQVTAKPDRRRLRGHVLEDVTSPRAAFETLHVPKVDHQGGPDDGGQESCEKCRSKAVLPQQDVGEDRGASVCCDLHWVHLMNQDGFGVHGGESGQPDTPVDAASCSTSVTIPSRILRPASQKSGWVMSMPSRRTSSPGRVDPPAARNSR